MLVFDENSKPLILDSVHTPTLTDHIWVLDLEIRDFTLAPLLVLEEIVCPSITVRILGFEFVLPSTWNILVYDEETTQLDVVDVANLAGREFTALVYGPNATTFHPGRVAMVDYSPSHRHVGPSLHKQQLLCHPISPKLWINVAPSDTYNKYLRDLFVCDIVGN